ncbi:MAG: glycosyltransferase [Campylobacterales bacterium]|nr:glycosyltransferase [Campylobacterales bacterium]
MKKEPTVTILILTFNSGVYLEKTINSCLTQTYKNIEVIVVDDCSTDGTVQYLESLKGIRLIKREANQGISRNVNFGVQNSSGEYILILGHDDILPCTHIENMIKEFNDDVGLVHCNAVRIDSGGKILKLERDPSAQLIKTENVMQQLAIDNFISSCGLIFKKEVFMSFGGWDESYKLYGEWLSYIKFSSVSKIKFCETSHAYYRVHNKSTMKMINNTQKIDIQNYKRMCRDLAYNKLSQSEKSLMLRIKRGIRIAKENFNG